MKHDFLSLLETVHPRACGELLPSLQSFGDLSGSSPRLRGTPAALSRRPMRTRFIPAPAGNSATKTRSTVPKTVHPRACGELLRLHFMSSPAVGSSPRLRGTPIVWSPAPLDFRFIPAPAGNSLAFVPSTDAVTVHPRACGELIIGLRRGCGLTGSSPRLRGTRPCGCRQGGSFRFIPAPAGNSVKPVPDSFHRTVHPRACGELAIRESIHRAICGSSPRLRGTLKPSRPDRNVDRFIPAPAGNSDRTYLRHFRSAVHPRACGELIAYRASGSELAGSSPRLRGTLLGGIISVLSERFIPAPAGNSRSGRNVAAFAAVHPRACGELAICAPACIAVIGSSPRLRGTLLDDARRDRQARFIPAPAGNSSSPTGPRMRVSVHPRACGELSHAARQFADLLGSSPRLRGTPDSPISLPSMHRFIPAPAGNSPAGSREDGGFEVHPRACGELTIACLNLVSFHGSSPRLRGTRWRAVTLLARERFIPAPAGNSSTMTERLPRTAVHPRACGALTEAEIM